MPSLFPRAIVRGVGRRLGVLFGFWVAGCASGAAPPPLSAAERARLEKVQALEAFAGRCRFEAEMTSVSALAASDAPPSGNPGPPTPPSVFLDLAFFSVPVALSNAAPPAHLALLADDRRVELLAVTHQLAELGRASRTVVAEHTGPLARPLIHELVARPNLSDADQVLLDLQVVLQLASREPSAALEPREHGIAFATAPRAQHPVALSAPLPEEPGRALLLLLTPYVVRDQRHLREIFQCKMADRQRVAANRERAH